MPFYFDNQPDNEIHFLVELHRGEAFCCKWITVEREWIETINGGYPRELIEMAYGAIEGEDIVKLLREAVDVREL